MHLVVVGWNDHEWTAEKIPRLDGLETANFCPKQSYYLTSKAEAQIIHPDFPEKNCAT